jgi:hypothetical protein
LEVKMGEIYLTLSLKGRADSKLYHAEQEEYALFDGKWQMLASTLWEKEIISYLKDSWEGSECTLDYGQLRHQMSQKARGYESKASKAKGFESFAYTEVASRLRDKKEVRSMLAFLKGAKSILINTFQFVGKGRIRIAYLEPERK